jgi:hypothetical protein
MKRIFIIIAALMLTSGAFAQAPQKMNFQAVIRDASNVLITNQSVGLRISILQSSTTGTVVYEETQTATTNINGLVTLEIGTGSVTVGALNAVDWGSDSFFIKTEADPAGGTNYAITGVSQLMSVPYAFHANSVENDMDEQTLTLNSGTGELSISGGNTVTLPNSTGDNWGTQTVTTDATLTGNGTSTTPLAVSGDLTDDQTLTFNSGTGDLTITGGNTITLPTTTGGDNWGSQSVNTDATLAGDGTSSNPLSVIGGTNYWSQNTNTDLHTDKKVGINVTEPLYPLDIFWSGQSGPENATRAIHINTEAQNTGGSFLNNGILSELNTNAASGRSIWGNANGSNFGIGVVGESNTTANGYGVAGYGVSSASDNTLKVGVYGWAKGAWDGSGTGTGAHVGVVAVADGAGLNKGIESTTNSLAGNTQTQFGITSLAQGTGTSEHVGIASNAQGGGVNKGIESNTNSLAGNTQAQFGILSYAQGTGTGNHIGIASVAQGAGSNTGIESNTNSLAGNTQGQFGITSFATGQGSGAHVGVYGTGQGAGTNVGVRGDVVQSTISAVNYGIVGNNFATGDGTANSYNTGIYGYAENNTNDNYGIDGTSNSSVGNSYGTTGWTFGTSGTNYAIYGQCGTGATTNYAGFFNGDVNITGTLTTPSDERLKTNIKDVSSVLDNLNKLSIKEYEFKSDLGVEFPKGKQFGFIAQNVATIYPNLVKQEVAPTYEFIKGTDEEGNETFRKNKTGELKYNSVNYLSFIPLLTEGIQEQQVQINAIEKENKELRLMIEKLIEDNIELKSMIETK